VHATAAGCSILMLGLIRSLVRCLFPEQAVKVARPSD
jgi:hypothetical protein